METGNSDIPVSYFSTVTDSVSHIFATYGWLLLFVLFGVYVAYRRIKPRWDKWQDDRQAAQYHKDPDQALSRMQAVEAARQRLQAQHDAATVEYAAKLVAQEEEKRQQRMRQWQLHQEGRGYYNRTRVEEKEESSNSSLPKSSKSRLRNNDYNPLMGSGGSGYRPARPSFGPSGGGG